MKSKPLTPGQKKARKSKSKGRRFQVIVAEMLAQFFGLSIEANPPRKPGVRKGVAYVMEGQGDLRVRNMGQAGADVALVSHAARKMVSFLNIPFHIECKNLQSFSLDQKIWEGKVPELIQKAWGQAVKGAKYQRFYPVLVITRNFYPPIVVVDWLTEAKLAEVGISAHIVTKTYLRVGSLTFLPLEVFLLVISDLQD